MGDIRRRQGGGDQALYKYSFKERIIFEQNPSYRKSWCLHLSFFFSALRPQPCPASPRALGCPFLFQIISSQLWLLHENGTLLSGNKFPTQERGASHTSEATSESVVTPWGQVGLRLYFNDDGVTTPWGLSIQEFHQKAVYAHSSLSCPRTSKWWRRTIKIPLFMRFLPQHYNLVY